MKRNILITEMLYPKGHRTLDDKLIELFSNIGNVEVCNYKDYFKINNRNIRFTNLPLQLIVNKHEPIIRFCIIINLLIVKLFCKSSYDTVVLLSSNSYITSIIHYLFPNKEIWTIHHNDLDAMIKYKKIFLFQKGMSNVKHVVFSQKSKEILHEITGCSYEKIISIPHPITIQENNVNNLQNDNKNNKVIVGIGLSNDEDFIRQCVNYDKTLKTPLSYNILLRSKTLDYEGTSLKVIKGFMSEDDYQKVYKSAYSIVLLYPRDFIMRYSGTFINAIVLVGRVISNKIEVSMAESAKYPNMVTIIEGPEDLFSIDREYFSKTINEGERLKYLQEHSDEAVIDLLKKAMQK